MAGEFVDRTSVETFNAQGSETRQLETINPNAPLVEETPPQAAPEAPSQEEPITINTVLSDPRLEAMRLGLQRDYTEKTMGVSEKRLEMQRREQMLAEQQRHLEAQADALKEYERMARLGMSVSQDPELSTIALERFQQSPPAAPSGPTEIETRYSRKLATLEERLVKFEMNQAFALVKAENPDFMKDLGQVMDHIEKYKLLYPGMEAEQIAAVLDMVHAKVTKVPRTAAQDAAAQRKLVDQATQAQAVRTVPGSGVPAPPSEPSTRRDDGTLKSYEEMAQELTKR